MDLQLKGKNVLVLGSSRGLGFAMAKAYSEEGASVAICGRDEKRIAAASEKIANSIPITCDLTQKGAGIELVSKAEKALGTIDILITNTGDPPSGVFSSLSSDDWQKGFDNLWISATEAITAVLPGMKKKKWGRILLSTSAAAKEPMPNLVISGALRAGLLGMMKSLSLEVATDGITVNAILPGYTQTEIYDEMDLPLDFFIQQTPMGRLGKPEEYASLAVYLGSQKASFITGQAIACDGGYLRGL